MKAIEIAELARALHKPELAEQPGMVYQIWEDGELTLQKCGELLWQRNLHCIEPGDSGKAIVPKLMPMQYGNHGYAFVDREGAKQLRQAFGLSHENL